MSFVPREFFHEATASSWVQLPSGMFRALESRRPTLLHVPRHLSLSGTLQHYP